MLDSRRVEMDAIGASPARGRSRLFSGFSLRRVLGTVRPSSAAGLIGIAGHADLLSGCRPHSPRSRTGRSDARPSRRTEGVAELSWRFLTKNS